jgi:hypothetical protein
VDLSLAHLGELKFRLVLSQGMREKAAKDVHKA